MCNCSKLQRYHAKNHLIVHAMTVQYAALRCHATTLRSPRCKYSSALECEASWRRNTGRRKLPISDQGTVR
jgi:hypothetical protein